MNNERNSVCLTGRLGKTPEVKRINGKKLTRFLLVTITWRKGKDGKKVSRLQWYHAIAWGRHAALAAKDLKKGTRITVYGKLRARDYQDQHGVAHHITEIVMTHFTGPEQQELPLAA